MKHRFIFTCLLIVSGTCGLMARDVLKWKFITGGPITAAPMIRNGLVYAGSTDKKFYAVDAETGLEVWRYETGEQIRSTAAFFENGLCFESGNHLYALNGQGELLWEFPLETEGMSNQYDSWDYIHSSPLIHEGIVYAGTLHGKVFGVRLADGTEAFQCSTGNEHGFRVRPAIDENRIFIGDWNGIMYAYDLNTGEKLWEYNTHKDNTHSWMNAIQTAVIVHEGVLYFAGRCSNIYALNPADGALIWKWHSPTDQWLVGGPVIAGDVLYNGSSDQHLFYALDIRTGKRKYETLLDHRVFGGACIGDSYAYVGSGGLYSLELSTGKISKRWPTGADIVSVPALENGILYFGCNDGALYALDQSEFDRMNPSETIVRETEDIDLGDIPVNRNSACYFTFVNRGAGDDSVTIEKTGSSKVKKAVLIDAEAFHLPAGDSVTVSITVDPSDLKVNDYLCTVYLRSRFNLENLEMIRKIRFSVIEATSAESGKPPIPETLQLKPNCPNPFNPDTTIMYGLDQDADMELFVCDNLGHKVATLFRGRQSAGSHQAVFHAGHLASGVYICTLMASGFSITQKMILLK
ncbi:PQQ-binding-like beta-propeller repeat protein [bacterium]|nr:PQQ-binding-like beta-propeller repeat protein [bacterium]